LLLHILWYCSSIACSFLVFLCEFRFMSWIHTLIPLISMSNHNLKTSTPIEVQAQFKDPHSNWSSFWWENPPATRFSLVTWLLFLAFPKPWKVWDMISQQCYISWEVIDIRSFSSCIASLWSVRLLMKIKMWETSVHLTQRGRKLLLAFYWLGNWHWWKLQYSCRAAKWTLFSAKIFTYSELNVSTNCDSK
jgi:hypothetical protein